MHRRLLAVVIALMPFAFAPPSAPGESSEEGLNPPLVGMHEVSDPAGMFSVRLPEHIEPGGVDPNPTLVAAWKVWLQPDTVHHLTVWVSRKSAFSRAALHASMTGSYREGELGEGEGSGPRGENEWWEVRHDKSKDKAMCRTFRMIEHGGEVFEATVSCTEKTYPIVTKHIAAILASFKGTGKPAPPAPPAGFKVFESGGREVWSNDKAKAEVDRALALHAETWDRLKPMLPPQFADTSPPRVFICKDAAAFSEFAKNAVVGEVPPYAYIATPSRAVVIQPSAIKNTMEYERQVRLASAIQCVRAAFGGPTPYFVDSGFAIECLFTTPKPLSEDKPNPAALKILKATFAKRTETLRELLDYGNAPAPADMEEIGALCWGWHWYLRHGPDAGLDATSRYGKYMDTFVKTGDALAARALWDGADFAAMKAGFEKWLQTK